MITKKQLEEDPDFSANNGINYIYGNWDYEFRVKTQELYDINDGFGEPQFVCKVTDFDELKRILETNP
jgi:hypothetical protein